MLHINYYIIMLMSVYLSTNVIFSLMVTLFNGSFFICDKYYHSLLIENYKNPIILYRVNKSARFIPKIYFGIICAQEKNIFYVSDL